MSLWLAATRYIARKALEFTGATVSSTLTKQTVGTCTQACEADASCVGVAHGIAVGAAPYQCKLTTDFVYSGVRYSPNGIWDTYIGKSSQSRVLGL
jgi:hypothetical protein